MDKVKVGIVGLGFKAEFIPIYQQLILVVRTVFCNQERTRKAE